VNVHFLSIGMFSINRGRPIPATLTLWQDRRVSLKCAAERLKNVFSVKGEKNIVAFLALVNGAIMKVKSKSMISFVKGRGEDEDFYTLSFAIHEVLDESIGNLFNPIELSDEGIVFRQYYEESKREKTVKVVETDFSPLNLNLGVRIIYEHFTQSVFGPEGEDVLFNDFETRILGKIYALADIQVLTPNPEDDTVDQVKKSSYWQKALPRQPQVKPADAQATKATSQTPPSSAAVAATGAKKNWWEKAADTLPPEKKGPRAPPARTAPSPVNVQQKAPPIAPEVSAKAVSTLPSDAPPPPRRISDIMRLIKDTRESRSSVIREMAPSISWNSEGIKSVMTGLGDLERNRVSSAYAQSNRRGNYRIYFKDFPGVATNEESVEFPINIDNISESGALFSIVAASSEISSPFAINDTVMLEISIVGFFDREIFGKVVRGTRTRFKNGKIKFSYAVKFSWIAAPPAFVEAVRKTQLFITAEQLGRDS